jgi:hypothetical protein
MYEYKDCCKNTLLLPTNEIEPLEANIEKKLKFSQRKTIFLGLVEPKVAEIHLVTQGDKIKPTSPRQKLSPGLVCTYISAY